MLHVLSTMWSAYPGMVIVFFAMVIALIALIPGLIMAWSGRGYSDAPIDDYVYPRKGTDVCIEFPTLIDTKAEWSYQPQGE